MKGKAPYGISFIKTIFSFSLLVIVFFTQMNTILAQEKKKVDILHADAFDHKQELGPNVQRLVGDVELLHNGALMYCDSAYIYSNTNNIDAFGHVVINQGDTVILKSNNLFYAGNTREATAVGNVSLINVTQGTTLTTDTLVFNLENNIGYYDCFGQIVDSTNTLTSIIGQYYMKQDLVYFYKDVHVLNEDFSLISDTLIYNTNTGILNIEGPTTIKDSVNTIYAEDGWYDSNSGESELIKNPFIQNETQSIKGDTIEYFKDAGKGYAYGNVEIIDQENKIQVNGNKVSYDDDLSLSMVTDSALLTLFSDEDTLYLHADTITSVPDTVPEKKILKAYHGVRFFRNDIQGVCDSLLYFEKDSTIFLYKSPMLWAGTRQMTADFIEMRTYNDKPDEVELNNNAFIISKQDSIMFDQIKGKNMIGFIKDGSLFKIDVDGNGQTLYYAQDKQEMVGLNSAESSKIQILFKDGAVHRIKFLSNPEGVLNPLHQLSDEQRRLNGFGWHAEKRPLTKHDVFKK